MRPMRSMFHGRRRHHVPTLNVASMPDLIFTVLFFFMIVTHMRSDEVKVRLEVPAGSEVKKLAGHPAIVNIYIGRQGDKETGRRGDKETRRQGDRETGQYLAGAAEWRYCVAEGDSCTHQCHPQQALAGECRAADSQFPGRPSCADGTRQRREAGLAEGLRPENQLQCY